jgi:hypothetical protein
MIKKADKTEFILLKRQLGFNLVEFILILAVIAVIV